MRTQQSRRSLDLCRGANLYCVRGSVVCGTEPRTAERPLLQPEDVLGSDCVAQERLRLGHFRIPLRELLRS